MNFNAGKENPVPLLIPDKVTPIAESNSKMKQIAEYWHSRDGSSSRGVKERFNLISQRIPWVSIYCLIYSPSGFLFLFQSAKKVSTKTLICQQKAYLRKFRKNSINNSLNYHFLPRNYRGRYKVQTF